VSRLRALDGLRGVAIRPTYLRPVSTAPASAASGLDAGLLVRGVRAREVRALAELHDRFAVLRILRRILGPDHELEDLHHDVFVRALRSIDELRDPAALGGWLNAIAVHTAQAAIERRTRQRRWFSPSSGCSPPEAEPPDPRGSLDAREALRAAYAVLDQLPSEERVAFALRYVDGMELTQVAQACRVSLATIKRRLVRAEASFCMRASGVPALASYLEGSTRWTRA
jgi:RNA polymerase sigma-70 factor (ECF subfamily)